MRHRFGRSVLVGGAVVASLTIGNFVTAAHGSGGGGDRVVQEPPVAPRFHFADSTKEGRDTLEVRDAPIRWVLEMLCAASRVDYSIDNNVGSQAFTNSAKDVTQGSPSNRLSLHYANKSPDAGLRLVCRSAPIPVTFSVETKNYSKEEIAKGSAYYSFKPLNLDGLFFLPLPPREPSARQSSANSYQNERDVPRRVSAVLRHEVRSVGSKNLVPIWYAVVETDLPSQNADTTTDVVQVGSSVASPRGTKPVVRVIAINTKSVTLQGRDNEVFDVPLTPLEKP